MGSAADRLRRARIEAGFRTAAEAIERFGWAKGTYPHNENGNAPFSRKKADAYAKAFGVRADWLYSDEGPMREGERLVPIVGYVGAGAQTHLFAEGQGPFGEVLAPVGSSDETVAVEIKGESLGAFFDEWLVFYDDVRSPITPDMIGKALCVVGLPDGRILIKQIRRSRTEGLYHLLSQTEAPITDVEIIWAAKVISIQPR